MEGLCSYVGIHTAIEAKSQSYLIQKLSLAVRDAVSTLDTPSDLTHRLFLARDAISTLDTLSAIEAKS